MGQANFHVRTDYNSGNSAPFHGNNTGNYYPPPQGQPPFAQQQGERPGDMQQWGHPEGAGRGGGYYGDGYYRGRGNRGMRQRGRGFNRPRGRGFQPERGMEYDIYILFIHVHIGVYV